MGERCDFWGDTHFARHLAVALRELGQDVVIDHREGFERPTAHLDDVVLVLRGLETFQPAYGQVNLLWVISHPEMVSRREVESYDRVVAASRSWANRMSRRWELRIEPLLQATDPHLFHPDRGARTPVSRCSSWADHAGTTARSSCTRSSWGFRCPCTARTGRG